MIIINISIKEDCLDSTIIKEFAFDQSINREYINYLGKLGSMQYFPEFPKPFFSIIVDREFKIKGIEGEKTIRIIFDNKNDLEVEKRLILFCNRFTL
ncbi:MAG: hypothetical protein HQK49_17555 [Oligoflexia bacterium]|nr:hypothetical protein [Oligoflexia bacterium]